jgi:hypothetical protein
MSVLGIEAIILMAIPRVAVGKTRVEQKMGQRLLLPEQVIDEVELRLLERERKMGESEDERGDVGCNSDLGRKR